MEKFKLVVKAIVLWLTTFSALLFIAAIDSIYDAGYFTISLLTLIVLIVCCFMMISGEDFRKITLYNLLNLEDD